MPNTSGNATPEYYEFIEHYSSAAREAGDLRTQNFVIEDAAREWPRAKATMLLKQNHPEGISDDVIFSRAVTPNPFGKPQPGDPRT